MHTAKIEKLPERAKFLVRQARRHKWTSGVELGIFRGRLFFALLDHCPQLSMIGVDTWIPGAEDTPFRIKKTAQDTGARSYAQFPLGDYYRQVMQRAATYGERAKILRMLTSEAASYVPNRSVDFVFIDACHEEWAVRQDIERWQVKIRPGGMLCGHDIDMPSVRRAVSSVLDFRKRPDAVWYAYL